MKRRGIGARPGGAGGLSCALLAAILGLVAAGSARADLVLSTNAGGITFGVSPAGAPQAGAPVFDASGGLLSAGGGYPLQGAATPPVQNISGGYTNPLGNLAAGVSGVANPALIAPGFGTGGTALQGFGGANGGGILWSQGYVSDPAANGVTSFNYSQGQVELLDRGTALTGTPGVYLGVGGTLGNQAGAYVEASLIATFVLVRNGGGPVNLGTINVTIASDGPGALTEFVSANSFQQFNGAGANNFTAYGVSTLPAITLNPGDALFIDGTLSLLADPPSSDVFFDLLPPPPGLTLPTFGVEATPEPSGVILLGVGLAAVAWSRAAARRRRDRSPVAEETP